MGRRARSRFVSLVELMSRAGAADPVAAVRSGRVLVDGRVIQNPAARVPASASVRVRREPVLRGTQKLRAALAATGVDPSGGVCIDVGAAAGGFTAALLEAGAARVYAVDAGHGQLAGWLRRDHRVVNLEATNLGRLSRALVPEPVGLVTLDLSYLSLAEAVPQLDRVDLAPAAQLLGLVKPTFELRWGRPPSEPEHLKAAVARASRAARSAGWLVVGSVASPVPARRGTAEAFLHARRPGPETGGARR